jgi:hypothetical protein
VPWLVVVTRTKQKKENKFAKAKGANYLCVYLVVLFPLPSSAYLTRSHAYKGQEQVPKDRETLNMRRAG